MFQIIKQGRLNLAGKSRRRGSMGAFTKLCAVSVVTSFQNSANVSSALVLFNFLMIMTAKDKPSAAESDFICRHAHAHTHTRTHTHSNWHYAGADCDPTPSQRRARIAACALVLHEFDPSFRWLCNYPMINHTMHGAHYHLKWYWPWHQLVLSILLGINDWPSIAVVFRRLPIWSNFASSSVNIWRVC